VIPFLALCAATAYGQTSSQPSTRPSAAPGFQGIWYRHEPRADDTEPALAGGLATFSMHHVPMAVYSERARKTFFTYGGAAGSPENRRLQVCIAAYDHASGLVTRPHVLLERTPPDPHGNAALSIDDQGYLWVFVPGVSADQRGAVFKSVQPNSLAEFLRISEMALIDPQPWFLEGKGFLLLHVRSGEKGREICFSTSPDGAKWSEPAALTPALRGCRAVSWRQKGKVGLVFNHHADIESPGGNPCYIESSDGGRTWTTAQREKVDLPLKIEDSPALVFDYATARQAVALKDLNFDAQGNPSVLLLMSRGPMSPASGGPFVWMVARWVTRGWRVTGLIESDDLMDSGCLHIETRNSWRLIGPTVSDDFGRAWNRTDLTHNSDFNHNYVRRPLDAQTEFYAFWADGAVRRPSESLLYFTSRDGKVFRLPTRMTLESARPELVPPPIGATQPASQGGEPPPTE
jgi:hypothetical protein